MSTSFFGLSLWDWLDIVSLAMVFFGAAFALILRSTKSIVSPDENGLIPVELFFVKERIESKKTKKELLWELILVVGLIGEVISAIHSIRETARLNLRVEELRKANDALEAKTHARTITVKQMEDFKILTSLVSKKIPIKISIGQEGFDTETYAKQMRDMFNFADFETPSNSGPWGVFRDSSRLSARYMEDTNEWPFVQIIYWTTNEADFHIIKGSRPYVLTYVRTSNTNFPAIPIVTASDSVEKVFDAIDDSFKKVKITASWTAENEWVKSNEFKIFIPLRNF